MALITLAEAVDDVRPADGNTADLQRKMEEASDIVRDYVTHDDKEDWTEFSAPPLIKAAVKLVLQSLYNEGSMGDPLSPAVKNILRRYRLPTVA